MIEHHIDYCQFTAEMRENEFTKEEFKTIGGVAYYPRGYRSHNGTRFYFGNNKGANCFVVLAGEQCQYLRDCGQTDVDLLGWAFANNAKISRLDLAVTEWNTFEGMFMTCEVAQWFADGLITSALCADGCKEVSEVTKNGNTMESVYIGDLKKRGKRGIFRAYDKGVEMDLGIYAASRIELELKRGKAHIAAKRIEQDGDIAGNFRTYFDVKHPTFERIMQKQKLEYKRGKGKPRSMRETDNDDRWKWLLESVAPALRDAIMLDVELGLSNSRAIDFMNRSGLTGLAPDYVKKRKATGKRYKRYSTLDLD